jgi:hypothetical protein
MKTNAVTTERLSRNGKCDFQPRWDIDISQSIWCLKYATSQARKQSVLSGGRDVVPSVRHGWATEIKRYACSSHARADLWPTMNGSTMTCERAYAVTARSYPVLYVHRIPSYSNNHSLKCTVSMSKVGIHVHILQKRYSTNVNGSKHPSLTSMY